MSKSETPTGLARFLTWSYELMVKVIAASLLFFCLTSSACLAQMHDVLCTEGDGNFEAQFRSGIKVRVGAARNGTFATRSCAATLSWDKEELPVADKASQVDVDGFGVDLGVGVPVATFQVKKSERDCCMAYQICAGKTAAFAADHDWRRFLQRC